MDRACSCQRLWIGLLLKALETAWLVVIYQLPNGVVLQESNYRIKPESLADVKLCIYGQRSGLREGEIQPPEDGHSDLFAQQRKKYHCENMRPYIKTGRLTRRSVQSPALGDSPAPKEAE